MAGADYQADAQLPWPFDSASGVSIDQTGGRFGGGCFVFDGALDPVATVALSWFGTQEQCFTYLGGAIKVSDSVSGLTFWSVATQFATFSLRMGPNRTLIFEHHVFGTPSAVTRAGVVPIDEGIYVEVGWSLAQNAPVEIRVNGHVQARGIIGGTSNTEKFQSVTFGGGTGEDGLWRLDDVYLCDGVQEAPIVLAGALSQNAGFLGNVHVQGLFATRDAAFADLDAGYTPWAPNLVAVSSLVRVASTAFATTATPHGFVAFQSVTVLGADQPEYNGSQIVSVVSPTVFSYPVSGTPATPATGTITAQGEVHYAQVNAHPPNDGVTQESSAQLGVYNGGTHTLDCYATYQFTNPYQNGQIGFGSVQQSAEVFWPVLALQWIGRLASDGASGMKATVRGVHPDQGLGPGPSQNAVALSAELTVSSATYSYRRVLFNRDPIFAIQGGLTYWTLALCFLDLSGAPRGTREFGVTLSF